MTLSRNLWAALAGALVLVDDWCSGPLLAWRYRPRANTVVEEEIIRCHEKLVTLLSATRAKLAFMVVAFRSNEITRYLPARAFLDFVFLASPTAWHSCSVAFWRREPDSTATSSVIPKPPFEARGVDDIMKLRKVCRAAAETTPSTTTTSPSPPEVAAPAPGASFSIQDKLEGLRPNSIRSWLEFRVSWLPGCYLLLCRHSSAEFVCTQVCDEVSSYTSREWKPISCHSRVAFNKSSFDNLSAAPT